MCRTTRNRSQPCQFPYLSRIFLIERKGVSTVTRLTQGLMQPSLSVRPMAVSSSGIGSRRRMHRPTKVRANPQAHTSFLFGPILGEGCSKRPNDRGVLRRLCLRERDSVSRWRLLGSQWRSAIPGVATGVCTVRTVRCAVRVLSGSNPWYDERNDTETLAGIG